MSLETDLRRKADTSLRHGGPIHDSADTPESSREDAITAAVSDIVEHRAIIEQVKGMLMLVYGIDADAAFQLLRWQSQHHNVKLRLIAEQIAQDFAAASQQQPVTRRTYDQLLVTAYTRTTSPLLPDAIDYLNGRLGIDDQAKS